MASSPHSPPPSTSVPQLMKDEEPIRNWAELPFELTSSILCRLDSNDILENAQRVCTSWRRVSKDPSMWRKIVMRREFEYDLEIMCRHAVDRSRGGLVEINIGHIGTDSLLNYIVNSSSNLRILKLSTFSLITTEGLTKAFGKLPLLEDLEVSDCTVSGDSLRVLGQSCPKLKTLKLNCLGVRIPFYGNDDGALAIAETMHGLRFLQLLGNGVTDAGLNAILDNCPDLEHLDLRKCFIVYFLGDLEKRCSERIKVFRRPYDSIDEYHYEPSVIYTD